MQEVINGTEKELKIDAVASAAKEYQGDYSRGIKCKDLWYNVTEKTEDAVNKMFGPELLAKGNTVLIRLTGNNRIQEFIKLIEKGKEEDMINLETLLTDAHKKGIIGIHTEMISIDSEKKMALFKATVIIEHKTQGKQEFSAHGDASPENITSDKVKLHYIRMAESRAIVRALRFATNNAQVAAEETE